LYKRWKFTILLAVILCMLLMHGAIEEGPAFELLYQAALAVVFLAVILALCQRRETRVAGLVLGIPTLAGVLVGRYLIEPAPTAANICLHGLPIVFIVFTTWDVLRTIFRRSAVTADDIMGAFCGYLLLGVAFGHLYCVVEWLRPGSFHVGGQVVALPPAGTPRFSLLGYFSMITLTTVGYGDVTPVSPPARMLAAVEGVTGQFYVAVVVAAIVALKASGPSRQTPTDRPTDPES